MSNYIVCGHSSIGRSHEDKGIKCQDSCCYRNDDNIVIAAVADGVSSSKHSDIASKNAVNFVVDFLFKHIDKKDSVDKILEIIKQGFDEALFRIKQIANGVLNDYDTTLTVAVLIDDNLYYGQIGDSGIVALLEDGKFERVTEAQNGEGIGKDRPVYPLAAVSKWCFNKYDNKVIALFLATDGVLKHLEPPLLETAVYKLNHAHLVFLYNNVDSRNNEDSSLWIKEEVENMPPEQVDYDDKTLVVVVNKNVKIKGQPKEYYEFPTPEFWNSLLLENDKKLYPYKYEDKQASTENIQVQSIEKKDLKKNNPTQIEEKKKNYNVTKAEEKSELKPESQKTATKNTNMKSNSEIMKFNPTEYFGFGILVGAALTVIVLVIVKILVI